MKTYKNLSKEDKKIQHNLQMGKIKSYLLDTKINNKVQKANSNSDVKGFILAFNTRIKNIQISLLLFLDIRTARVERYLINSSDPLANKLGLDFRPDLFYT